MTDAISVEFPGTDEELERRLLDFSRAVGGWAARESKPGHWRLSAGSLLSTNPNTVRWRMSLRREGSGLIVDSRAPALPGCRAKLGRILRVRRSQLVEFLSKGAPLPAREPFATFGSDPASVLEGVAWTAGQAVGSLAAGAVAMTLASLPLIAMAIQEILDRSRAAQAAGAVALPNPDHPLSLLGGAFVFAGPLAFLGALTHWAALVAADLWTRAERLPLAAAFFVGVLLAGAFFPFLSVASIPLGLAVPIGIHLGVLVVWGRRPERLRQAGRPPRRVILAGGALAVVGIVLLGGALREGPEFLVRVTLFRDRFMLGNAPGRAAAALYYRHTLVSADPLLKRFYSSDDRVPCRLLRTARSDDPKASDLFRKLHFTIVPPSLPSDVRLEQGILRAGSRSVPWTGDPAALDRLAGDTFRGDWLAQVYGLAWLSLYYAGPFVGVFLGAGAFAPAFAILFRRLRLRAALGASIACFLVTSGLLVSLGAPDASARLILARLREAPDPAAIREGLAHPAGAVRHEAAVQAYFHPDTSLRPGLMQAADDPDLRVRLWAVAALGMTGHPQALSKLVSRLEDPELFVRYRAAEGLGHLRDRGGIEPLLRLARQGSWYEGLYALEALRMIDPERF